MSFNKLTKINTNKHPAPIPGNINYSNINTSVQYEKLLKEHLIEIITKDVAIAFFILSLLKRTNTGIIIKPPPAPN